ncbi:TIGR02301 family protein [Phenylobacterium sp.]|uniref:TIGR02301 family protein n=1 Tax=Phenylobacterium sp. TaxID=1871053 RepID=UPI00271B7CAF|nr:TIGR02301 family protein [Phenylobacterium sp.]MDO8380843.1 TIGR02301 family protein [Phenylobacterium sp.]
MRRLMLPLALAALALPALAQDRSPALRQSLVDLAYVLGESHALRQACVGVEDQYWRTRMINMVEAEKPDESLDRRLKESFNTGFASRQSEFQACTSASRRAEMAAASHGLDISNRLAKVMVRTEREAPPTIFELNAPGETAGPGPR